MNYSTIPCPTCARPVVMAFDPMSRVVYLDPIAITYRVRSAGAIDAAGTASVILVEPEKSGVVGRSFPEHVCVGAADSSAPRPRPEMSGTRHA